DRRGVVVAHTRWLALVRDQSGSDPVPRAVGHGLRQQPDEPTLVLDPERRGFAPGDSCDRRNGRGDTRDAERLVRRTRARRRRRHGRPADRVHEHTLERVVLLATVESLGRLLAYADG